MTNVCRRATAALGLLLLAAPSWAQGTLADYERAAVFQNAHELVSRRSVEPHWIGESDRFWYVDEYEQRKTFVLVDPEHNGQGPAFDHAKLAAALSSAAGAQYQAQSLPFDAIEFRDGLAAIVFKVKTGESEAGWRCELKSYACATDTQSSTAREGEALSPDGRWAVFSRAYNLWVRDTKSNEETALTDDGEEDYDYGSRSGISYAAVTDQLLGEVPPPEVYFSPDSRLILSYRIDARKMEKLGLVQTVMGAKPRTFTYRYPVTGDQFVAQAQMILFDLEKKTRLPLQLPPLPRVTNYDMQVCWNETATQVCFTEDARGYKSTKIHVADTRTGEVRTAFEEHSDTYVNRFPAVRMLENEALVWSSERDGWNHLYSIDSRGGTLGRQLTRGEWAVREILHVDEKRRTLYFTASGKERAQDPYYQHLYSVKTDGASLRHLTPEPAFHEIRFSPTGRYFVDNYSRLETAPVSVLRAADGRLVRELQRADIGKLRAAGWRAPEPFNVKARDGKTDIYGAIFRPSNFDPSRRYPILDAIYPGPQAIRTAKTFDPGQWEQDQALAELGFIVITIDGLGTPFRSRAFRDFSYGNLGDAGGLEDHIAGIRQLGQRYPYLDVERVGIYGHSGGGYASARAILKFPEFYKVAVSLSGDHDLRSYWAEWGERFHGYPVGENFVDQANATLASRLEGKLLLAHGDLDDNVHPAATLQLVDALIAANKDFDLLILPNRNHLLVDLGKGKQAPRHMDPYFLRRRWDYFVQHLLGEMPPKEFELRLSDR